jgi:hypothetical protein
MDDALLGSRQNSFRKYPRSQWLAPTGRLQSSSPSSSSFIIIIIAFILLLLPEAGRLEPAVGTAAAGNWSRGFRLTVMMMAVVTREA